MIYFWEYNSARVNQNTPKGFRCSLFQNCLSSYFRVLGLHTSKVFVKKRHPLPIEPEEFLNPSLNRSVWRARFSSTFQQLNARRLLVPRIPANKTNIRVFYSVNFFNFARICTHYVYYIPSYFALELDIFTWSLLGYLLSLRKGLQAKSLAEKFISFIMQEREAFVPQFRRRILPFSCYC